MKTIKSVAVYCGSGSGKSIAYEQAAINLGQWIADNHYNLVYGGASVGLMGTLANTALQNGAKVTGVIPEILLNKEIAHPNLTELITVENMHARKQLMMERADCFIALPGGAGTMEEIFEVITWAQIGIHQKPYAFYNINGYYDHLNSFLNHMEQEGFLTADNRVKAHISRSLDEINDYFHYFQPPLLKTYKKVEDL